MNQNDSVFAPFLCIGSIVGETSFKPVGEPPLDFFETVRDAGFVGMQGGNAEKIIAVGMTPIGNGRIDALGDALELAQKNQDRGMPFSTVHAGTGWESDDEAARLVEDIIEAGETVGHPILIETHRATLTQDIWRTVNLVERFPEMRINGDFSHYYTGHEMPYGDWDAKMEFMQPIFDRVRFMHGRIGNPSHMQVAITYESEFNVQHFKDIWQRCFQGFLKNREEKFPYLGFSPELLFPGAHYAREFTMPDGSKQEESDRWQQAQLMRDWAAKWFAEVEN